MSQQTSRYTEAVRKLLIPIIILIGLFVGYEIISAHQDRTPSQQPAKQTTKSVNTDSFNKKQYSLNDPASIWIVVNKTRPLQPKNYAPADLVTPNIPLRVPGNESMEVRKVTGAALEKMFTAAKADNTPLMLSSGYRSYKFQVSLYGGYVQTQGQETADTQSARPGFSEHQTGLAADIEPLNQQCNVEQCFADTSAGKWLAANSWKYGFIIRYTKDKTPVTGYTYEPWHVRYVGIPLATELHNKHIETLEEFFGTGSAPDYN